MNYILSDDHQYLETLCRTYSVEYKHESFQPINDKITIVYLDLTYSVELRKDGWFKVKMSNKEIRYHISINPNKTLTLLKEVVDDNSQIINLFTPSKEGYLTFFLIKYYLKKKKAFEFNVEQITSKNFALTASSLSVDDRTVSIATSYLVELIVSSFERKRQEKLINYSIGIIESYIINFIRHIEATNKDSQEHYKAKFYVSRIPVDVIYKGNESYTSIEHVNEAYQACCDQQVYIFNTKSTERFIKSPELYNRFDMIKEYSKRIKISQNDVEKALDYLFSIGVITNPYTDSKKLGPNVSAVVNEVLTSYKKEPYFIPRLKYLNGQISIQKSLVSTNSDGPYGIIPTHIIPDFNTLNSIELDVYNKITIRFLQAIAPAKKVKFISLRGALTDGTKVYGEKEIVLKYGPDAMKVVTEDDIKKILEKETTENTFLFDRNAEHFLEDGKITTLSERSNTRIKKAHILKALRNHSFRSRISVKGLEMNKISIGSLREQAQALNYLVDKGILIEDEGIYCMSDASKKLDILSKSPIDDIYRIVGLTRYGEYTYAKASFVALMKIEEYTKLSAYKQNNESIDYKNLIEGRPCPQCGSYLVEKKSHIACTNCSFKLYKEVKGVRIGSSNIQLLLSGQPTQKIMGFSFKNNKNGIARLHYSKPNKRIEFLFD